MDQYSATSETIYVTGPPSTGKTTMVQGFLRKYSKLNVYLDCAVVATPSQLYCDIVKSLIDDDNLPVLNSVSFVATCLSHLRKSRVKKFHIVLDNAHCLKYTQISSCLPLLLHLNEFIDEPVDTYRSRHCIQLILVTSIGLPAFSNLYPPNIRDKIISRCKVVILNPWSKKEMIERISSYGPVLRADIYPKLVNNIVELNYKNTTKDFKDLKYLCEVAFERFVQQFKEDDQIDMAFYKRDNLKVTIQELIAEKNANAALSYDMMHLITGAYIASFSNSRDDKANFVKCNRKTKRRKTQILTSCQSTKPFTLERLLQIYRRLRDPSVHERINNPRRGDLVDSVLANILTLIDLNYFRIVGEDGLDGSTKLSIADYIDYRYARNLAKHSDIELDDYLR